MKTFQFLVAMALIVAVGGVVNPAFAEMKSGKQPAAAASRTTKSAEKVAEKTAEKATEKAPRKAAAATKKKSKQGKKATQKATQLETGKKTGDRKTTSLLNRRPWGSPGRAPRAVRRCRTIGIPTRAFQASPMSDPHLIRNLLRHQSDFMAYLMAMVRDLDAAEEIFQNAAVVVMQHADDSTAEPIRDFRAWAKEIVRRQALHYLRAKGRAARFAPTEPELLEQIDRAFDEDDTDAGQRQREIEALRECARRLPEIQQRMVAMRYEVRASFDTIGSAVGRTAAAVQRSLSRTRQMLHDCVQSKLTGPEGVSP
jgi:RNA polymerase sigma factor (sigma-70 family)